MSAGTSGWEAVPSRSIPFHQGLYSNIKRLVMQNTNYIANLIALRRWYLDVRSRVIGSGKMEKALLAGALDILMAGVNERLKTFGEIAEGMDRSIEVYRFVSRKTHDPLIEKSKEFAAKWPRMKDHFLEALEEEGDERAKETILTGVDRSTAEHGVRYLEVIKGLDDNEAALGTGWLQGIVDRIEKRIRDVLPAFDRGRKTK